MGSDKYENFGSWMKTWRAYHGISQEELAKRVGKTKSYISNIERNQAHPITGAAPKPKIEVVDKIASALNRPLTEARHWAGYGFKNGPESISESIAELADPIVKEIFLCVIGLPPQVQSNLLIMVQALFKEYESRESKTHTYGNVEFLGDPEDLVFKKPPIIKKKRKQS